jgi:hypothetical protein
MAIPRHETTVGEGNQTDRDPGQLARAVLADLDEALAIPDPMSSADWTQVRKRIADAGVRIGAKVD